MPNPRPTPEQRAEWRRDAEGFRCGRKGCPDACMDGHSVLTPGDRILALLEALEEIEEELKMWPRVTVRHGTLPPLGWDE